MPVRMALQPVANQIFTALLDDLSYGITIRAARGVVAATVSIDGVVVVSGARFYADTPLIPFPYLEGEGGNFIFTTEADALPEFTEFDVTQFLFYLTAAEVASAR